MLTPASTNPTVTQIGDQVFRICYTDDYQGTVAAQFALKEFSAHDKPVWKRVAIFTDSASDYSKGLAKAFKDYFTSHGGQVVEEETFRAGNSEFRTSLQKIISAGVDAVFFPAYYGDVSNAIRQARQIQLNVPFFGGDGWDSPVTLNLGDLASNCYFTNHYSADDPRPEVQNFVKNFKAKYNEVPDAMATLGYDAMLVMADAISRSGSAEPESIRQALAETKNFVGATGSITIDENRNAKKPIVVLRVQNGKFVLVDSLMPQ
jgi:branched-chain amino acid transport system substrate-binding protein